MSATFEPLYDTEAPATVPVIPINKHPWSAAIDQQAPPPVNIGDLAFGWNLTQTPEYAAYNPPPYQSPLSGGWPT